MFSSLRWLLPRIWEERSRPPLVATYLRKVLKEGV